MSRFRMLLNRWSKPTTAPAPEESPAPIAVFVAPRVFHQLRLDIHRFRTVAHDASVLEGGACGSPRAMPMTAPMDRALDQILAGRGLVPEHPLERVERHALCEAMGAFGFRFLSSQIGRAAGGQLVEGMALEWVPSSETLVIFNRITPEDLGCGEN